MNAARRLQGLAGRAGINILVWIVSKVGPAEGSILARAHVPDCDMGRDLFVDQPGQELAGSVRAVSRKPVRLQAKSLTGPFNHVLCGRHLILGPRWRCLDIDDDRVLGVDQIVEAVAELNTLIGLCRPGGRWIRR